MVTNDAGACMMSLLTDPRVKKSDYTFFGDDPFAPPPVDLDYISDINTGRSYRETWQILIKDDEMRTGPVGKRLLVPTPLYIDGAVTGQFSNLPVTQLKMTLGIFNMKARDKPYLWRDLGMMPHVETNKSRGCRFMMQSRHCDGIMAHQNVLEMEGTVQESNDVNKLEDYHAMLGVILDSFVKLQNTEPMCDFRYGDKVYKDTIIVPFVPYLKVDNEEADKLCGRFGTRTGNVKNLCRRCKVPTRFTARALADYPLKTKPELQDLIEAQDWNELRELSQHQFTNAFYRIQIGS